MYKYVFAGIFVVVLMSLVTCEKQQGACGGKAIGEECVIGANVVGLCVEFVDCKGEPDCGLICKVEGHPIFKRQCCNPCRRNCRCCYA